MRSPERTLVARAHHLDGYECGMETWKITRNFRTRRELRNQKDMRSRGLVVNKKRIGHQNARRLFQKSFDGISTVEIRRDITVTGPCSYKL